MIEFQVATTAFSSILTNIYLTMMMMSFREELQILNTSSHQRGVWAWRIFCGHQATQFHHWLTWQSQILAVFMQRWEIFSGVQVLKVKCWNHQTQAYEICHGEDISEVPTETIASNLKHLKIVQTNISILRDEAFQNKEIEVLSLTANRISSIET